MALRQPDPICREHLTSSLFPAGNLEFHADLSISQILTCFAANYANFAENELPDSANRVIRGAGSQLAPCTARNSSIRVSTSPRPTASAYCMGPPRQAGKP